MSELSELAELYELGDVIKEGDTSYLVFEAWEKSLKAPCIYHRFNFQSNVTQHQEQMARALLKRYAGLEHAGTPRFCDAWTGEDHLVVIEYRAEGTPFNYQGNNPLNNGSGISKEQLIETTLYQLSALHYCGLIHGNLTDSCYGLSATGKVILLETGLDAAMSRCFGSKESVEALTLSTNLFGRDTALWAFMILSFLLGNPIVEDAIDERWDDFFFSQAHLKIDKLFSEEALRVFFKEALKGLGPQQGKFDAASDALSEWKKNRLGDMLA